MKTALSIVIPAKDEAGALVELLPKLRALYPDAELIVVNDASTDETADVCSRFTARVVTHLYNMGNGAAVKAGARAASGDVLVFMDADGQHDPQNIPSLLRELEKGFDMVVGARAASAHASLGRRLANSLYNGLSSWISNHPVRDLTSGFRAVRADRFKEFLHLLPNGFSYPTTITMAFFRTGYTVSYVEVSVHQRTGNRSSHINPLRDGIRFFLIIFKVGTLYSPLKVFFPISVGFMLSGLGNYTFTYLTVSRFTNMSAVFLIAAVLTFLMGLLSEQITALLYSRRDD